jgi:HD-GYP domain-containing protein (c-di-GMP phosphodiesterase class II)
VQEAVKISLDSERPKIFLFFSQPDIIDLLSVSIESFFHCSLQAFPTPKALLEAFKTNSPLLVVVDGAREDTPAILEALSKLGTKVILHHQKKQTPEVDGLKLAGVFNEQELLPGISSLLRELGLKTKDLSQDALNPAFPFLRMGIPLLLRTNPLVADVYIRLSPLKFLKLFHAGASFGQEDVEKYHNQKKVDFFYIRQEDSEKVTSKLNEALESLLKQIPLPQKVSTSVSQATIDTLHSLVNQVGFTPEVQKLVKNGVDLVLKEMYAAPSLSHILKNLELDREKYISAHSHLLAEVSCALSIAMKWDSDMTFRKLTMAALLHDMGISNHKLARIKDLNELGRAGFSASENEEYRSHSKRASVLIKGFKEVPADVDKIIGQHHENPMGTGFPEALSQVHIHPLAALAMVAHDLVDWVLDHQPGETDVMPFLEAYAEKYKAGNFRKLLKALYSLQS